MVTYSGTRARRAILWIALAALSATLVFVGPQTTALPARADSPIVLAGGNGRAADFNGDGISDILWYAPGAAADHLWTGSPSGFSSQSVGISGNYQSITGDFDGDGADDVLWYAPGSAPDYVWYGGASGFSSVPVGVSGSFTPVVGDFDGDGADDVLWYAPGSAPDYVWYGGASGFSSVPVGVSGSYTPVVGDFDGNGIDDVLWYAPGTAADHLWLGRGSRSFTDRAVGISGSYTPIVGNFDGAGGDEIVWYAPGAVPDYLWTWASGGFRSTPVTVGGDYQPIVGDFDGDGRDDIVWYAPGPAADHLWHSGPNFSSTPLSIGGHYQPVTRGAVLEAPPSATSQYGAVGVVPLHLPSTQTRYIGFHQSGSRTALTQSHLSPSVRWGVMPSRGRGTGLRTAADIVMPRGATVLSPVTGVVIEARSYMLYGVYLDSFVAIAPTGYGGEVLILHMAGLRVKVGDLVTAGVTEIADTARRFPFGSQVDLESGAPLWPHVHVEVSSQRFNRVGTIFG